jgi:hypothetical protein
MQLDKSDISRIVDELHDTQNDVYAEYNEAEKVIVLTGPGLYSDTMKHIYDEGLKIVEVSATTKDGYFGKYPAAVLKLSDEPDTYTSKVLQGYD